jgi:hypothetical protein
MRLGPICGAWIGVPDFTIARSMYAQIGLHVLFDELISEELALRVGAACLVNASSLLLGPPDGAPWLRLIHTPHRSPAQAFSKLGWMALEMNVLDVDSLAGSLDRSRWKVLGEPADLDVGDAIRAMQVQGPGGEVWYLTQIKRPLPPFVLPDSKSPSQCFVAVLACANRQQSLCYYQGLGGLQTFSFETKLSAYNQQHQQPLATKHPVGVVQLRGSHLLELDELPTLPQTAATTGQLPEGIALIELARSNVAGERLHIRHPGAKPRLTSGPSGELILLL